MGGLYLYEIILLILGTILFLALTAILIFHVIKQRPIKNLLYFFGIPIIMIGFPSIQSFQLGKDLVQIEKTKQQIARNPDNTELKEDLKKQLNNIETRPIDDPEILSQIAEAEAATGDSVSALETVERILNDNPGTKAIIPLQKKLDKPTIGIKRDLKLLEKNPNDQQAKDNLNSRLERLEQSDKITPYEGVQAARAYAVLGNKDKAIRSLLQDDTKNNDSIYEEIIENRVLSDSIIDKLKHEDPKGNQIYVSLQLE